jgi:hypothetical protein
MEFGMGGAATAVPIATKVFEAAFPDYKRPPAPLPGIPIQGISPAPALNNNPGTIGTVPANDNLQPQIRTGP